MSNPLVTVILPAYNAERFIAEAIESVIAQSVEDWELIVVDDGSTDGTREIIADYQRRDRRIRVLTHAANRGLASARNTALDHARGRLIAFIDSDDVWFPEKTARQIAAMERHRADISYTGYERWRDGKQCGTRVAVPEQVTYRTMLGRNKIAVCTAMIQSSTCGAERMLHFKGTEDHRYWLALLRDGSRRAVGVAEPLARYRVHRNALTANKLRAARHTWQRLREMERFGLCRSLRYFISYACGALKLRLLGRFRYRPVRNEESRAVAGALPGTVQYNGVWLATSGRDYPVRADVGAGDQLNPEER